MAKKRDYLLEDEETETEVVKKSPKRWKIAVCIIAWIVAVMLFFLFTKPGRSIIITIVSRYISSSVQHDPDDFEYVKTDDGVGDEAELDIKPVEQDKKKEDYVTNYLLIGIEKIYNARNTDAVLIASINTSDNTIKLTSLLRDTLVEFPGYSQNKLNAAYVKGGAEYLMQVVEENFKIELDGYASVDFDAFEKLIDLIGGIEIELTQEESEYLNTTNYISNEKYRKTVPGLQLLNGNQVLGYCRVRKVPTLGGQNYDYGRTVRQRRVLSTIFETYKKQNIIKLFTIMDDCMQYITTDVTQEAMKKELTNIIEHGITTMDMYRIPAEGAYTMKSEVGNIKDVLVPDLEANIVLLHDFIYNQASE